MAKTCNYYMDKLLLKSEDTEMDKPDTLIKRVQQIERGIV